MSDIRKINKKSGFSLIELIVVITIMMVVTAVGIVSYSSANKSSRDGRRKSDLEKIRVAAEMYKQEEGMYPPSQSDFVSQGFLAQWPSDPQTGKIYQYARGASGYTYTLRACLENTGTNVGGSCCVSGAPCNYEVTNP